MANYEEIMRRLQDCKPEKKDELLMRIYKGEKVDITKDEDLFYQINKDRMSMDDFVNRDRFLQDKKEFKEHTKDHLVDTRFGKTKDGKGRLLGEIPAEIFFAKKELSDPSISDTDRLKAVKKFFNDYPSFRAGDKRL